MLLFYVGDERYACDCDSIIEVVTRVPLKQVAHAPPYLAGLIRYGGFLVPVVDFAQLRDGRPSSNVLSTRIMIFRESSSEERSDLMGLKAERVTEMIKQIPSDFSNRQMAFKNAPYLTGVYGDERGVVQLVDVQQIFPMIRHVLSGV